MSLISIIIPMRNAEQYVKATLESVLAQRGVELEAIVVDDGSTDGSAAIVRAIGDPRVRIIAGPQRGISAAVNTGLAAAHGELVARCDADDLYPPNRLSWQVRWLEEHPDFGAVCGSITTITEDGEPVAEQAPGRAAEEITSELRRGVGRSHMCAYAFRASVLREIGGCREWFVTSEDADLQYRLSEVTRIGYEPTPAYLYRLHDASITHTQKSAQRAFFADVALKFQEQRRQTGADDLMRGKPPPVPSGDGEAAVDSSRHIQDLLLGEAWRAHADGHRGAAIAAAWRACRTAPGRLAAWKSLLALLVKPAGTARPIL